MGQLILTGSSSPNKEAKKEILLSRVGRFEWLIMCPMTLFESGESNGSVSLENLFYSKEKVFSKNFLTLKDIAFLICRGG